ncbi:carbohydrate ABC transporter permease [Treponema sp. HNW]|uniref:carbohydrate ABC transporter permease n=1 Tax=Treponema sp. HNW TaxID=3116654 RepID=UPI003D117DF0
MKLKRGQYFLFIFGILWSVITIYPLFVSFLCSLKDNQGIFGQMFALPRTVIWQNYYDALFAAKIFRGVWNSLKLAVGTTMSVCTIALFASYALSRDNFKFIRPLYLLFLTGVMIPIHTTIIPISKLAAQLQGANKHWMLILVYTTFQLPQAIFLITGYLNGVSRELDEAAIIDGCGRLGILLRIMLPVCTPIIATVAILSFIYGYSELVFSVILLHAPEKYPISRSLMYFTGDYSIRMGPVFASIIIAVLPMIIIYLLFHENVQRGMLAGAVKG